MEKLAGSSPDVYIGSLISLTSKAEIRYEGVLHTLEPEKSTIVLEDVRSFGTEGRGTNILPISASSKVYEYIIFRDTDIKDLSVLSFPGNFGKPINKVPEGNVHMQSVKDLAEKLKGDSLDIALGWPVSPYSSCTQECANWWLWLVSPASGNNGIPPSVPLAFVPKDAISHSSSSSSLQGNHGTVVMNPLAKFEQVPTVISANVCNTQNSEVPQHLPVQGSASGKGFISGHLIFQKRMWPQREKFQIKPLKVQPLLQQPLLPLPVSETEHRRLITESICSSNLEHFRRPRFGSRGRVRGAMPRRGAPSRAQSEVSCSTQQFSEDFDFEAMNELFNKKELWHDLDLNDQPTTTYGEQNDTSEKILNTCSPSRKLLFVDDFFDLVSPKDEDCKETRAQGTKSSKQRQIDLETFGVSSRPGRGRRNGLHKGVHRTSINTERNSCCTL